MNRKHFLSSLLAATALSPALNSFGKTPDVINTSSVKIPSYLKTGDTIGIVSPAGYIDLTEVSAAVSLMESWGFHVKIGSSVGKRDFTYGGTDAERLADFQQMLDDSSIQAIMCARGGYGLVRIIDQIDFSSFKRRPKWIIGFSDITVLHSHLSKQYNIASIHSKMCNSFPADWTKAEPIQIETILSIKNALMGDDLLYRAPAHPANQYGSVTAPLVGGNLSILETMAGSPSDLDTKHKILFVEDTGEYLYSIDRMFWNLKRSGKLQHLKGLIVGGFKLKPDDAGEEFGKTIYEIVMEKVQDYHYPVAFDFPVGHQRNNFALKCGLQHCLEVMETGTILRTV